MYNVSYATKKASDYMEHVSTKRASIPWNEITKLVNPPKNIFGLATSDIRFIISETMKSS